MPGQMPVQLIGERLSIRLAERRRSAGIDATGAQLVHEAAHAEKLLNIVIRIKFTARIQRIRAFLQHVERQRNVGGNDQVAGFGQTHDFIVGHVETSRHLDRLDEARRRHTQQFVGNQRDLDFEAVGYPEQDFLDDAWTGVGIDPDFHLLLIYYFNFDAAYILL